MPSPRLELGSLDLLAVSPIWASQPGPIDILLVDHLFGTITREINCFVFGTDILAEEQEY